MYEWHSFLDPADEWFITYSLPPPLTSVKLFAIGHTVELYLKAANAKMSGDIERAIKFGHEVKAIWDDCKARDSRFMPNYQLRNSVFEKDLLHGEWKNSLDESDRNHFLDNQELYVIAKHLPDLKYLAAPLKTIKAAYGLGFIHPNPYWITFLKELRGYLGHPDVNRLDKISHHIEEGDLPPQSIQYLKDLYV